MADDKDFIPVRCGCGGEPLIRKHTFYRALPLYQVRCSKCGTATTTFNNESEAILRWNKAMGAFGREEYWENETA